MSSAGTASPLTAHPVRLARGRRPAPTCAPRRRTGGWGKRTRAGAGERRSLPAGSTPARPRRAAARNAHTLASALRPRAGRPTGGELRSGPDSARDRAHGRTSPRRPASRAPSHRKAAQLARSPGGWACGAATHHRVWKPEQYWLPDGRHDDGAPTCQEELR